MERNLDIAAVVCGRVLSGKLSATGERPIETDFASGELLCVTLAAMKARICAFPPLASVVYYPDARILKIGRAHV